MKLDIGNIFKSMIGYFWGNEKTWKEDEKPIKYVVAKSGLYEIRETEILRAVAKPKEVKGMSEDLEEGIVLKTPKIPYHLYYKALKFLRAIYLRDQTEATIHFFWDREKHEYFLWVPKQQNGGASSDYERDKDEEFTKVCQQHVWVMTAHSHPTFAGSFSSIDDKDEKDTRLFMVVGHIMKNPQDINIRTAVNGAHVKLDFYDVFTNPMDEVEDVPNEWLDRCTKKAYKSYSYGGYNSYKKYGNGYSGYGGYSQESMEGYEDDYGNIYYNGRWMKQSEIDAIYDEMDKKYAHHQYGTPIGMDEELDEQYYNAISKDDYADYCGTDPVVINAMIEKEIAEENRRDLAKIANSRMKRLSGYVPPKNHKKGAKHK